MAWDNMAPRRKRYCVPQGFRCSTQTRLDRTRRDETRQETGVGGHFYSHVIKLNPSLNDMPTCGQGLHTECPCFLSSCLVDWLVDWLAVDWLTVDCLQMDLKECEDSTALWRPPTSKRQEPIPNTQYPMPKSKPKAKQPDRKPPRVGLSAVRTSILSYIALLGLGLGLEDECWC